MRTFDAVLPYLKKSYTRILGGLVMLILVDLVQLAVPKVMQYAIDHIQERTIDQQGLLWIALIIFAFAIAVMVLRFFWRILIIGNSYNIEKSLRQDFYDHLLVIIPEFFNKSKTGDLMAYATNDLNAVRQLFGMGLISAMDIVLMTIASFAFMVSINPRLTLLAVLPMPVISLTILFFGKKMHRRFKAVQECFAALMEKCRKVFQGLE